ncbi:hypothetical protein BDN72DRAFT_844952 [Pluteus cervinus]|uniref:Uncharacterized protein n=1 Tax=Pluteus cervinus TaxID=181527 RepID=A0ACD3AJH0_9AGAR|nr:hypothetical protein BDN72DRAFT_844952 [Pluteus cervinus]
MITRRSARLLYGRSAELRYHPHTHSVNGLGANISFRYTLSHPTSKPHTESYWIAGSKLSQPRPQLSESSEQCSAPSPQARLAAYLHSSFKPLFSKLQPFFSPIFHHRLSVYPSRTLRMPTSGSTGRANPQRYTLGSGGMVNNNTTNNIYDHSRGKSTVNSNNNTTYYGSNINQFTYPTVLSTPPAPAGRPTPIDILRERVCAGAAFDSAERGEPPRCHLETRTAILSSGSSWADNLNAICCFMWITGWAGVGKSAILQTLAEEYRRRRRLAASFFFFQASQNRNTIQGFVATIAGQLMDSIPATREIILQKISDNPTIFTDKSFNGLWQTLIIDTLCHPTIPHPTSPMLVVIDGVDEIASPEEQCTLLRTILHSLPQLGSSYKFLIASRPESQIKRVFQEFHISQESKIELGNSDDSRADIRLFLQISLSRIHHTHNPQSTSPPQAWPQQSDIEHLVEKASGQFVYASTIVRFVESLDDDPQAALEIILKGRDIHANSFKELDYLYLLLMERIERSTQKKNQHMLIHLLVCIYMHLVNKVGDEVCLLHPDESNKDLVKNLLRKLEPVLGTNGEYRHKSFIEFLVQPSAPHIFSINSWHISGVISLCLPVFLKNNKDKGPLLCFLEWASPTPDLVSCLGNMPQGQLAYWDFKAGCKDSGYLWNNELTLGWLGYQFSKNSLQYSTQIPLYQSIWEPYYKERTMLETSPEFYVSRAYDLADLDVDRIGHST